MANSPYLPSAGVDTHHPLLATDDDDDQVFCVVCDGECTCPSASRTAVLLDSTPSAYSPRVSSPVPTSNSASRASLKIKLPAGLLSKARASTSTTHVRSDGTAKRLGRPLKPDVRKAKSSLIKPSNKPGRPPRPPLAKKSAALKKKRKNRAAVPWEESDSDLTDLDAAMLDALEGEEADFLAPAPTHLPTFLPASAVQSSLAAANSTDSDSDSSSDSSSTAGFGTDVSMEAEEEDFIIGTSSRHKDRTRVPPRKEVHNKWEIKPRLRSVSMEAEMEVDSGEETEADDDDEDEEEVTQDGAGGETTDADAWGGTQGPVATTWSDGEESDLDVEVFFAGLGSGSSSSSSDEEDVPAEDNLPVAPTPRSPTSLFSFEHTQSWDVDTMFSSMDGLPTFMDADLACFYDPVEESSMSEAQDATMSPSDGYEREDEDDGEDNAWSDDDGGVTTDEDLVDAVGLPTPRAMALFQMPITPASLASVAPLATVSPYVGTVIRNGQPRPPARPADILAGRAPYMHDHTSDEHDDDDPVTRRARSASWSTSRGGKLYPRMGRFDCTPGGSSSVRQAVIDGQTPQIQSPFPRRARSLRRSEASRSPVRTTTGRSRGTSFSGVSFAGTPLNFDDPLGMGLDTPFSFNIPLLPDTLSEFPLAPPIELEDVLHTSILSNDDTEAEEPPSSIMGTPGGPVDISRWDYMPLSSFRQASTTSDLLGTPGPPPMNALKQSPYPSMLWPTTMTASASTSAGAGPSRTSRARSGSTTSRGARSVSRGPYAFQRDLTPTPTTPGSTDLAGDLSSLSSSPTKSRQDARRERRMARKAMTLPPPPPSHTPKKRPIAHHAHHGNGKSRSGNSVQRSGGHSGSPSNAPPFNW